MTFGNFTGWMPSLLNHNLASGTEWGAMNIHMNQVMMDMQARSTLYMTPVMDFNGFSPFGMPGGSMSYLLDPAYTIGQWAWNNNAGMNNSIFGGGWSMAMPSFNFNSPWGMSPINNTTPSTPSNNNITSEDRICQKKFDKLKQLVTQLISTGSPLSASAKEELEDALKHPEGKTIQEKFNHLKSVYDKTPKETIKKFLTSKAADKFSTNGVNGEKNSFYLILQTAGFEFSNSAVDLEIRPLHDAIKGLKDNNGKATANILGQLALNSDTYDILDVISSWNTQNKDGTKEEKRIITYFAKQYEALTDKNAKEQAKISVLNPVVNALIGKARSFNDDLDSASQAKIENSITKLNNALNAENINFSTLSNEFDNLYILTREAAIATIRADVVGYYGTMDPDLFNDELFVNETKQDLLDEGFGKTQIEDNSVINSASALRASTTTTQTKPKTPAEEAKEQAKEIKEFIKEYPDALTETKRKTKEGHPIYKSKDNKQYVLKNGLLYEIKNNKYSKETANLKEIKDSYFEASKKEKYTFDDKQVKEFNKIGEKMQDCLHGYTTSSDWDEFNNELLTKVNSTNVMHVIAGFNAEGVGLICDSDKFFTQLMSESHDSDELESIKNKVLKYVNEYIDENIEYLEESEQTRVKELKAKLNSETSSKELDNTMVSLFKLFKIEDQNSHGTGTQWAILGGSAAAGAGAGAAIGSIGGPIGTTGGFAIGAIGGLLYDWLA